MFGPTARVTISWQFWRQLRFVVKFIVLNDDRAKSTLKLLPVGSALRSASPIEPCVRVV